MHAIIKVKSNSVTTLCTFKIHWYNKHYHDVSEMYKYFLHKNEIDDLDNKENILMNSLSSSTKRSLKLEKLLNKMGKQ